MSYNDVNLYDVFKARDPRFDGRYFVGVSSTGIYCRPVCKAKHPKIENCTFFRSAAEAEKAGYRPCLLCRPELAPGSSPVDSSVNLAHRAARLFEENCAGGLNLEEFAEMLGCTDRHLRRVFIAEYNVTPIKYLQTCRLLLAKSLLTDTNLSVLDVAMSSGFGSLRRFNDAFKTHYKLSPSLLRKQTSTKKEDIDGITVSLGYRPPYLWNEIIEFLHIHAISGIELVKDNEYLRTVSLIDRKGFHYNGWIRIGNRPEKNLLKITLSESLLPVITQILSRVRRLFDLNCDPNFVYSNLSSMNDLTPGLCIPGIRIPGCFDSFEMSIRTILGQQISMKAASTLAKRIVDKYGSPVRTGIEGLTHAFPSPDDILSLKQPIEDQLGPLGIIATRSRTIHDLAEALINGDVNLNMCSNPEEEIKKLMRIKGIGNWTAQYIAMRAMEWPDAFLETDAGIKKALEGYDEKERLKLAEAWRPWRSYATINLWNSL